MAKELATFWSDQGGQRSCASRDLSKTDMRRLPSLIADVGAELQVQLDKLGHVPGTLTGAVTFVQSPAGPLVAVLAMQMEAGR